MSQHRTQEECTFLEEAIDESLPLKEIREHLSVCDSCKETLKRDFEIYLECGLYGDEVELPPGIKTEEEFLNQLRITLAHLSEQQEFALQAEQKKLKEKEVQEWLQRLLRRVNRMMVIVQMEAPDTIVANEFHLVDESLRQLHDLMGPTAFSHYMDLGKGQDDTFENMRKIWREAILGTRK